MRLILAPLAVFGLSLCLSGCAEDNDAAFRKQIGSEAGEIKAPVQGTSESDYQKRKPMGAPGAGASGGYPSNYPGAGKRK